MILILAFRSAKAILAFSLDYLSAFFYFYVSSYLEESRASSPNPNRQVNPFTDLWEKYLALISLLSMYFMGKLAKNPPSVN